MRTLHFGLRVADRERSLAFYRDVLGLAVVGEIDDGHVTVFGLGDGLALVMHAATQEELGHAPLHAGHTLFFQVDDPDGWGASSERCRPEGHGSHRRAMGNRGDDRGPRRSRDQADSSPS